MHNMKYEDLEYMPKDILEAIQQIIDCYPEVLEAINNLDEIDFRAYAQPYFGMKLRNKWGLWYNDTEISRYFISKGIRNGDDKSGIILAVLHRYVRGNDINLDALIEAYKRMNDVD